MVAREAHTCSNVHGELYHALNQGSVQLLGPQSDTQVWEDTVLLGQAIAGHVNVHTAAWQESDMVSRCNF